MENGAIKVWLPAIRAGSGSDVFTRRLACALERHGMVACITWFPRYCELLPLLLRSTPPAGTDIILTNSWVGHAFRHAGLPLVVTVHHSSFSPELQPYKSLAQRVYHRFLAGPREIRSLDCADAITAVSEFVADGLRARYSPEKVEVIHHWVDTGRFRPCQPNGKVGEPFRLLFVGRPSQLKGWDMLAPLMRRLGPGFELQMTVDTGACREMHCPDNMHSIGRLAEDELIRAYQRCDAVLVPSRSEGFGYVALEAMACGKPVVASDVAALPEIVASGFTGILCGVGDVESFADACRRLAGDPELCRNMGEAGRLRATQQFAQDALVGKYLAMIRRLVAK